MCKNYTFEVNYFEEDGKTIKASLFSDEAQKVVNCFLKPNTKHDYQKNRKGELKLKKKLSASQIRKFYNEILNLKTRLENGTDFKLILPYFKMLKAKAHVAYERDVINTNFKTFIEKNVDYVTAPKSYDKMKERFTIFCTFFEAVVAYAKGTIND